MRIEKLSPKSAILQELGERLARHRKQLGHSQEVLAKEAGVGVATLRRIELGKDAQLGSWIKLLKALGREAALDALLPEASRSPMAEVRGAAGRSRRGKDFNWGDERS